MKIDLKEIKKSDEKRAMQFAIKGMHLDRYISPGLALNAYARYFWYLEKNRASQCIAAYVGERLVGILLSDMKGEPKRYSTFFRQLYVCFFRWLMNLLYPKGQGEYDLANKRMLDEYLKHNDSDGEIIFLAADLDSGLKGIGSLMLAELERIYQ